MRANRIWRVAILGLFLVASTAPAAAAAGGDGEGAGPVRSPAANV